MSEEVVELEGGLKYTGEMQRGLPNGYGKLTWPNGDYYEGNFKFGKRNGYGKRINVDGSEYQGEYLDDKPNGRGKNQSSLLICKMNRFVHLERWRKV